MRKVLISLAVAASALTVAAPASAQWYPQPNYGYGSPYGYTSPWGNEWSQRRAAQFQHRIDRLQAQIRNLDRRNILSNAEARRLRQEARVVERNIRAQARYGLSRYEVRDLERRLARLERMIHREARDGNRYGYNGYGAYGDRDRDGRIDRYEDDRGWDHD